MRTSFAIRFALVGIGTLAFASCTKPQETPFYKKVPVTRQDVIVTVSADGSVLPLDSTDVKSKASGEVIAMLVETGDEVHEGQLLVQIDPRNPSNAVTQAQSDLDVAQSQLQTAESQFRRAEELYQTRSIAEQDYETVRLQLATAKNAVVRATVALQNARIAFEDTDVKAPTDGVVLAKNVERGTVISSATAVVGGGTVLLKIANVDTMQVRAMVDETDIGKVAPGQDVTITVDAYPNRTFAGKVLKIEPQAVVQQNVIMFPVLAKIPNPGHPLRAGMNCSIEIHIGDRRGVLAVPNASLRSEQDVASAATVLGLTAAEVRQQLAASSAAGRETLGATPNGSPRRGAVRPVAEVFGGDYIVFVLRQGTPWAVPIRTGLNNLNYAEVTGGLSEGDTVLLLPSASLVAAQQGAEERAQRMGGAALPGVQRQSTTSSQGARP